MRAIAFAVLALVASGCTGTSAQDEASKPDVLPTVSFDGADYVTAEEKIAHGRRLSEELLACNSCHLDDYSGANFGEVIPLLEGLWATNISRTLPDFTDEELETLLREGTQPDRDIYLMPSRTSQFLSDADMGALIAYLRTIEPTGNVTPLPPPGFEEAVVRRLPDDGWRVAEYGRKFYPNAAEEVAFYRKYRAEPLGREFERGRYIAAAVCSSCHGPGLDGYGEDAGSLIDRPSEELASAWADSHAFDSLTTSEIEAVRSYVIALASKRNSTD